MKNSLDNISQITIYFKEAEHLADRVNEVALFQPLAKKAAFEKEAKPLKQRQWTFYHNLPLPKRIFVKIQSFIFHRFPKWVSPERRTPEAQFKTVLAILLAQETLRDFFLGTEKKQKRFLNDVQRTAQEWGFFEINIPHLSLLSPLEISRKLTTLSGQSESLLDNPIELNLQIATLSNEERNEILFALLNRTERPPLTSVIEITKGDDQYPISVTTQYAKTKIDNIDTASGEIHYTYIQNEATSSIRTQQNIQPGFKGAMNQRSVKSDFHDSPEFLIGSYSGQLLTKENVLEQVLFILNSSFQTFTKPRFFLHNESQSFQPVVKKVLFVSLYSWHEWEQLIAQRRSIENIDHTFLQCIKENGTKSEISLQLFHYNIPFNALNKYPAPGETEAKMKDLQEECLLCLTWEAFNFLDLPLPFALMGCIQKLEELRSNPDFLSRENKKLEVVDQFRQLKPSLCEHFKKNTSVEQILQILFLKEMPDGKHLIGIDEYLYIKLLAQELGFLTSTNCQNSTDRSAGANAADKAQNGFKKFTGNAYFPGLASEEEQTLFKVFYSMYLVWEEPELTSGLSTGFMGEKFFRNFFQKNPETTHYLIRWLKKNPDFYLGLSDYRS